MVAVIEAKAIHKDIPSVIDYQCKDYSRNIRKEDAQYRIGTWVSYKMPFTFATNGRPFGRPKRQFSGQQNILLAMLSVSTYVEQEDKREKIDIVKLNAEIEQIVAVSRCYGMR